MTPAIKHFCLYQTLVFLRVCGQLPAFLSLRGPKRNRCDDFLATTFQDTPVRRARLRVAPPLS